MSTPSSSANQARQDLGTRLREIRLDAGLTARDLARLMRRHYSKISRVEHGAALPSFEDIRAWCHWCGAGDQAEDLIATVKAVETMWVEWRRMERTGLRQAQEQVLPLYEQTRSFRVYAPNLLPGIVQTKEYTFAVLSGFMRRRNLPDDVLAATEVRMQRQRVLREGGRRFGLLLEESALHNGIGGPEVMAPQLAHLISVACLPNVSLGVIPNSPNREVAWPTELFWVFDNVQVNVELISGHLTITQPREICMYEQVFNELSALAVFGSAARALITRAMDCLE
jgi:transcriptional regulator with XRE-family HTH domain